MSNQDLFDRVATYKEALLQVGDSPQRVNGEFLLSAISNVLVRDALLKTLTDKHFVSMGASAENAKQMRTRTLTLFKSIATEAYGDESDWTGDVLGFISALHALNIEPNEATHYAGLGQEKGNHLSQLLKKASDYIPAPTFCEIFTQSIDVLTLEDTLDHTPEADKE